MNEETKHAEVTLSEDNSQTLADQLQAGHRSRISGAMMQGLQQNQVQFHEVMPEEACAKQPDSASSMPESYLNYAAALLEQMRGVYSTSWDSCNNGSSWHGGHHHFYNPCSGADVPPPKYGCPISDCTNQCGCGNKPQTGTMTYYDDCAYQLQKISDQLGRVETMTEDLYRTNQQLFSYLIEYFNTVLASAKN